MNNDEFQLKNLPTEAQDSSINKDDFKLIDSKDRIHEEKFQTRPTTFFKDCLKRFAKNKSSVVASFILGLLIVLAIAVPIIDTNDIKNPHPDMIYLEPKLFDAGTGFWDGTKQWDNIPVDTGSNGFNETNKQENWWPDPERYPQQSAITNKKFSDIQYTNGQTKYGKNGYIQFGYYYNTPDSREFTEFKTRSYDYDINLATDNIYLTSLDTYNLDKLIMLEGESNDVKFPRNYEIGKLSLNFKYVVETVVAGEREIETKSVELLSEAETFNVGSAITSLSQPEINLTDILKTKLPADSILSKGYFCLEMKNEKNHANTCSLIRSISFRAETANENLNKQIEEANFSDATECILRTINYEGTSIKNKAYWISTDVKKIYMSKVIYCSFIYDSYEAAFGERIEYSFSTNKLEKYAEKGWITWDVFSETMDGDSEHYKLSDSSYWEVLDGVNSPVKEIVNVEVDPDNGTIFVDARISKWQVIAFDNGFKWTSMPRFIFGTDKNGLDMLKYVFNGLLTSLILGILTFIVCFTIGLIYGSISGYFGGTVDLIMERITDILSGIPWIVVMTLVILKYEDVQESLGNANAGPSFGAFILALCLTGWIGTAATTRTQFYRFRGREYVLASRTLGASDARLISKHILPNALGTIITGAVLMIPSVIFSEATISYLGLGFQDLPSLGVILSANQGQLTTNSYLLIFPSVIIALLMISFNLFGNGLRDAVNPSLKGED